MSPAIVLIHMGYALDVDFSLVKPGSEVEIVWLSAQPQPTQAEIDAAVLPAYQGARKIAADTERQRRETLGVVVTMPSGPATLQTRHIEDWRNITGQVTAALILSAQGVTDPVLSFRDLDNVDHALTPAQMIGIGRQAQMHVKSLYDKCRAIKAQIDAASDVAAVESIDVTQGW